MHQLSRHFCGFTSFFNLIFTNIIVTFQGWIQLSQLGVDSIQKFSCQNLENYFKESSFCGSKNFLISTFYHSVLIITRNWGYINQFTKNVSYLNNVCLLDSFLGGFFLKSKLKKASHAFVLTFIKKKIKICTRKT